MYSPERESQGKVKEMECGVSMSIDGHFGIFGIIFGIVFSFLSSASNFFSTSFFLH